MSKSSNTLEWSHTLCDGERVTYEDAEKAVAALGEGWRLPTRFELESLLDLSRHAPSIDIDKYPDTESAWYWTSTPCAWGPFAAWVVGFNTGCVSNVLCADRVCVRAVREMLSAGNSDALRAEVERLRAAIAEISTICSITQGTDRK